MKKLLLTACLALTPLYASAALEPINEDVADDYSESDSDSDTSTVIDNSQKDAYVSINLILQDHEGRDLRKYKVEVTKGMCIYDFKFLLWHLELKEKCEIPDDKFCIDLMDVYLEGTYLQDYLDLDDPATLHVQLASDVIIDLK